jgi:hypothetical protein
MGAVLPAIRLSEEEPPGRVQRELGRRRVGKLPVNNANDAVLLIHEHVKPVEVLGLEPDGAVGLAGFIIAARQPVGKTALGR